MRTWKQAKEAVLARLETVQRLIVEEDESGVLELVNQQDEFCDAADERRSEVPDREREKLCQFLPGLSPGRRLRGPARLDRPRGAARRVGRGGTSGR